MPRWKSGPVVSFREAGVGSSTEAGSQWAGTRLSPGVEGPRGEAGCVGCYPGLSEDTEETALLLVPLPPPAPHPWGPLSLPVRLALHLHAMSGATRLSQGCGARPPRRPVCCVPQPRLIGWCVSKLLTQTCFLAGQHPASNPKDSSPKGEHTLLSKASLPPPPWDGLFPGVNVGRF